MDEFTTMLADNPGIVTSGAMIVAVWRASVKLAVGQSDLRTAVEGLTGALNKLESGVEYADSRLDDHQLRLAIHDEKLASNENRITRLEDEL